MFETTIKHVNRTAHNAQRHAARLPRSACVAAALILLIATLFIRSGDMLAHGLSTALLPSDTDVEEIVTSATPAVEPEETSIYVNGAPDLERLEPLPPEEVGTETLWLARCIYSETKRPEEQEVVAWVVRNRVETSYRGQHTYQDVVLDRMQFSAFNGGRTRRYYSSLSEHSDAPGWQRALAIAEAVRNAPPAARPFPVTTRHFYSERSMVGRRHPEWAHGKEAVQPRDRVSIDPERFRFVPGVR